ncbi:MerR HTH family regulatory protein [Roseospirillum parvum]|uniref:MerR HTH family regulatory protein n=1 Tax=Roseospirillum parvum TaxID=83401 RepID=A0A1G7YBS5_9PROT|nr:MerR HTH family regulatory protein [Roseospirillum parvum]
MPGDRSALTTPPETPRDTTEEASPPLVKVTPTVAPTVAGSADDPSNLRHEKAAPEKPAREKASREKSAREKSAREKSANAFWTIGEVADDLGVPQHVLRFWETKFTQVKPLKRGGGRRYYRPEDVALLRRIQTLLHDDGLTIRGVQKLLAERGVKALLEQPVDPMAGVPESPSEASAPRQAAPMDADTRRILAEVVAELEDLKGLLGRAVAP